MEVYLINKNNFNMYSMDDFDRHQVVENVYRLMDGHLQIVRTSFTENWSLVRKRQIAAEIVNAKYIAYGAFEQGRVIGTLLLLPELNEGRMIIDGFHVSAEYRRKGAGRLLFHAARQEAEKRGAKALYASACSAKETIDFYRAMGFKLSENPIRSCVEKEPFDLQMECVL